MITPEKDIESLRNALLSKKPDVIINIISKRTKPQLDILIELFQKTFNKDLIKEINQCLSYDNDLIRLISLLFLDPIHYYCQILYSSFNQGIKDINTIIEIILTCPYEKLKQIMNMYSELYNDRNIVNDIKNMKFSNNGDIIKIILLFILEKEKRENILPDMEECQKAALKLKNEQIKNWLNVNSILNQIIINNSQIELYYINEFYKKLTGFSIIQNINKEINEDEKFLLIEIISAIVSRNEYFAEKINKAVKVKNEEIILRIILTRREIDLEQIKERYFNLYNKSMLNDFENIFSGDCYKLIYNLVGI